MTQKFIISVLIYGTADDERGMQVFTNHFPCLLHGSYDEVYAEAEKVAWEKIDGSMQKKVINSYLNWSFTVSINCLEIYS